MKTTSRILGLIAPFILGILCCGVLLMVLSILLGGCSAATGKVNPGKSTLAILLVGVGISLFIQAKSAKFRTQAGFTRVFGVVFIMLAGFVLGSIILGGCSPRIMLPEINMADSTVFQVRERLVHDTFELEGQYVEVHDSFPCPPGLADDSTVYVTNTIYLPGQAIPVQFIIHDTVSITPPAIPAITLPGEDVGWPERLSWILGLLAVLVAWWRKRKAEQTATT